VRCPFCAIVEREAAAELIGETERALSFVDGNPANPGHMVVVPKAHAADIWELSASDGAAVWALTQQMAVLARRAYQPDGLNLFQANRRAAWQDVFHFHVHVVPRWDGDGLVRPWTPSKGDPAEVAAIARALRAAATAA
jgi:histidine triad (HIT) family protein